MKNKFRRTNRKTNRKIGGDNTLMKRKKKPSMSSRSKTIRRLFYNLGNNFTRNKIAVENSIPEPIATPAITTRVLPRWSLSRKHKREIVPIEEIVPIDNPFI
jgi:hypothetical protein